MPRSYKEEEVLLPGSERYLWLPVRTGVVGKLLLGTSTGGMPTERELIHLSENFGEFLNLKFPWFSSIFSQHV